MSLYKKESTFMHKYVRGWIDCNWMYGFYGISTFVGYLIPNPFLDK